MVVPSPGALWTVSTPPICWSAFLHAAQAQRALVFRRGQVEAAPVIGDGDGGAARRRLSKGRQADGDLVRRGVLPARC
ncbi:MAG: hypothetical protein R2856_24360 [Caldilineaceae bacterium]